MVSNDNDGPIADPTGPDDFDEDEEFDEDDFDDEDDSDGEEDDEDEGEDGDEADRPLAHKSGSSGFGPAIAGIMHGIDADIFRDPAAIQRMERDRTAVVRTADGTVIAIGLPGEGVIETPDDEGDEGDKR